MIYLGELECKYWDVVKLPKATKLISHGRRKVVAGCFSFNAQVLTFVLEKVILNKKLKRKLLLGQSIVMKYGVESARYRFIDLHCLHLMVVSEPLAWACQMLLWPIPTHIANRLIFHSRDYYS